MPHRFVAAATKLARPRNGEPRKIQHLWHRASGTSVALPTQCGRRTFDGVGPGVKARTFTPWQPLSSLAIDAVPTRPGVFELATLVRTIVYIGAAPDLAAALAQHVSLTGSPYSLGRRYFRFVEVEQPEQLQQRLLDEFARAHQDRFAGSPDGAPRSVVATPPGGLIPSWRHPGRLRSLPGSATTSATPLRAVRRTPRGRARSTANSRRVPAGNHVDPRRRLARSHGRSEGGRVGQVRKAKVDGACRRWHQGRCDNDREGGPRTRAPG